MSDVGKLVESAQGEAIRRSGKNDANVRATNGQNTTDAVNRDGAIRTKMPPGAKGPGWIGKLTRAKILQKSRNCATTKTTLRNNTDKDRGGQNIHQENKECLANTHQWGRKRTKPTYRTERNGDGLEIYSKKKPHQNQTSDKKRRRRYKLA